MGEASPTTSVHDLRTLILSYHALLVMETDEEARAREVIVAAADEIGLPVFEWSASTGLRTDDGRVLGQTVEPRELLAHIRTLTVEAVFLLKDFGSYLQDPGVVRRMREVCSVFVESTSLLVLTANSLELPQELDHFATYFELELPRPDELAEVVGTVASSLRARHRLRVDLELGKQGELVRSLGGLTLNQARQVVARAALDAGALNEAALDAIHGQKAELLRGEGLLEYFPHEDSRAELAGCARLCEWLDRAEVGFSERARELNLTPPRGVMLVGVQGCGKSLAAKVIARRWKLPLLKLDVGRLFDRYVGESERNFRKAIEQAEAMAPACLWLDEIEKAFAGSSKSDADGGLGRRMFGFFLTWLQEKEAQVFVVATANDLRGLPPELLRKGRFDEIFFVDLPDADSRRRIFEIHLQVRKQDPASLELDRLVLASEGFSGAEIEQAVISGLYRALHARAVLDTATLLRELEGTVPLSVSRREDVDWLRGYARDRFVPVD
ncbi:MAG: AAA family ATPase [Deltaproteobacteria bacterium]|nr:AAA family ATPase [Deltaproteobacteria bacterium]MBW2413726.1 AAA family ATPase [Deltaproteobacteria bacterium]